LKKLILSEMAVSQPCHSIVTTKFLQSKNSRELTVLRRLEKTSNINHSYHPHENIWGKSNYIIKIYCTMSKIVMALFNKVKCSMWKNPKIEKFAIYRMLETQEVRYIGDINII